MFFFCAFRKSFLPFRASDKRVVPTYPSPKPFRGLRACLHFLAKRSGNHKDLFQTIIFISKTYGHDSNHMAQV